jgi:hypothetical protein
MCQYLCAAWHAGRSVIFSCPAIASANSSVLAAHTLVLLSLDEDLRSGQQPVGDTVAYKVDKDVLDSDGSVIIAAGAPGYGKIITSSSVGGFGKNGKLVISCEYVTAVDGSKILFTDPEFKNSGGGTRVRALIRPLLLMPFSKGGDVKLQRGLPLTMSTDTDNPIKTSNTATNSQAVQVQQTGHNRTPFTAFIKSYSTDDVIFTTGVGDVDMKLTDVNKIILADPSSIPNQTN